MTWFSKIVNKEEVPSGQIYVAIQEGKAMYYADDMRVRVDYKPLF